MVSGGADPGSAGVIGLIQGLLPITWAHGALLQDVETRDCASKIHVETKELTIVTLVRSFDVAGLDMAYS